MICWCEWYARSIDLSSVCMNELLRADWSQDSPHAQNLTEAERACWRFHAAYVDTYHISFLDWVRNPAVLRDVCISCCDSQHITDWTDVLWTWLHKYLITPSWEVTLNLIICAVCNLVVLDFNKLNEGLELAL